MSANVSSFNGRSLLVLTGLVGFCFVSSAMAEDRSEPDWQFILRVEFYDLPEREGLRIQQEVSIRPNQNEARVEILQMVEEGRAAFVGTAPLICRPGERGKFEDVEVVPVIESLTWNEEAQQLVPKLVERTVGTVFEVDPQYDSESGILNLNFALEHHTGDPETVELSIPTGGAEKFHELTTTRLHRKRIASRIYLKPGTSALIGAFEITGKRADEDESARIPDAKRLAFLVADPHEPREP